MAIVQYSGLVNRIGGKLAGSVFSSTKGIAYIKRHNANVTDHRSSRQLDIRQIISDLAGEYYSLSDTQKELWNSYASMLSEPVSGINCFIALNQKLIYYLGLSKKRTSPPLTPGTPTHLSGLSASPSGTSDFIISWTSPALSTLTIIINYRPMFGIERTTSQQWHFGATAASSELSKVILTDYDLSTLVKFKCRTINEYGILSPWSHVFSQSALNAGIYGQPGYGYAFYNA